MINEWSFESSPCECCPHIARCRAGLACTAFANFIKYGGRRHLKLPREPSVEQYRRLYHEIPV
jgi:hypothetical protein